MPIKLTRTAVEGLAVKPERYEVRDSRISGFAVRISPGGRRTYVLRYRMPGLRRVKVLTLGRHGVITADQARELAAAALAEAAKGNDPANTDVRRLAQGPSVRQLANMYLRWLRRHRKPGSVRQAKIMIDKRIVPAIGHLRVDQVRTRDIADIAQEAEEEGLARTAGKVIQICRAMFEKAELDLRPWYQMRRPGTNPCKGLQVNLGKPRKRVLSADELGRIGLALRDATREGESPWHVGLILLLIFTGARIGELVGCQWDWVDLEGARIDLPDSKTGEKVIHLSPPALAVLERLPRLDGSPWLFPGTKPGAHLVNYRKPWARICERAGIEGARPHDVRRTFASTGLGGGLALDQIGALLGHSQTQTTRKYAHLQHDPAKKAAAQIGEVLELMISGPAE